ncbi:alpha/beta hydrolase [Sulfurifustis variabilis]|uniref:Alpha/beta hydrolase n=1 Tax=Sulfurifustis variabilis TaxID=1675686 RepID=A0A1B4V7M1_9GAMM|nr:alpha/beta fold hydrolase [Sulfurifustis variabilis]BAU49485.1 alpha/beta hydrolase [Sulfurifustis variabilis]
MKTDEASPTAPHTPRRAPAPPAVKLLRLGFGVLGRGLPGPTSRYAYNLWFSTRRFRLTSREQQVLGTAQRLLIEANGRPVAVYVWGTGPAVFMVHGWHGSAAHFAEFVEPLVAAGFRAVAFDAPAHGESPGNRTKLPEIVDAMERIARRLGPFHAVIGHSFGAMCTTYALAEQRIAAGRVVCISPPAHMEGLVVSFGDTLGLPPPVQTRFRALLERDFGADMWARFSPEHHAMRLALPALIIHDVDDRSVPVAEAEALARAWRGAELVRTRRLGHRRILADADVIRRAVQFIRL